MLPWGASTVGPSPASRQRFGDWDSVTTLGQSTTFSGPRLPSLKNGLDQGMS